MTRDCEHGQLARSCNICELESDLAHQKKLVRVLAEKLHEWDETPNKNESPFDFLAYAEAKVAEEEKQTSPTGAERKS